MDFRILGPVEAYEGDDRPIALSGARQRCLLAILALNANRVVAADRLLDEVWSGDPPQSGLTALQNQISRLRKLLESGHDSGKAYDVLASQPPGYVLRVDPDSVDAVRFERLLAEGSKALAEGRPARASASLRKALGLWRGRALGDLADEPALQADAARLEELRLVATEERIEADLALGGDAELIGELWTLIEEHPLRERLRAQLMLALYRAGRQAEALDAYQHARALLVEELGIEPGAELRELEKAILNQDASLARSATSETRTNLPLPANPLLGRERELASLRELLSQDGVRLVTLTGAGGSGKSRLALEVGHSLVEQFPDGVFLVALAPLTDPSLVLSTTARVVGVTEQADEQLTDTLAATLSTRELLLIFDNFEHVLGAAPAVAALLSRARGVRVLATSRAPLRVLGEREFPLRPLAVPNGGRATLGPEDLLRFAAVSLFVARATAVKPDFELGPADATAVAEICARLDGLPLALELAAARTKLLPPQAMLERLAHPLQLLTTGARDLPLRQRTLRETIAWSYGLLEPDEQLLFASLSVFRGGWTLAAAEEVCGDAIDVLGGLSSLLDSSVVHQYPSVGGEGRFGMLETIREYALERLDPFAEEELLRRHARHFLGLAETAEPEVSHPHGEDWLERLEAEHANLRAALGWARAAGELELRVRLVRALWPFWMIRGYWTEGRSWLEEAVAEAGEDVAPALRVEALRGAVRLARLQGDSEQAEVFARQTLELYEELENPLGVAWSLAALAHLAASEGGHERAEELWGRSLDLSRESADLPGVLVSLLNLTSLGLIRGDYERAAELLEQANELVPRLGDDRSRAAVYDWRGYLALVQGDLAQARLLCGEALALNQALGDKEGTATNLLNLGLVAIADGSFDEAKSLLGDSLRKSSEIGSRANVVYCVEALASLAAAAGQPVLAARLVGGAETNRKAARVLFDAADRARREATVASVRGQLDEETLTAALDAGGALTLDDLVREALGVAQREQLAGRLA